LVVEDEYALARLGATELDRLGEATLAHTIEEARTKLSGRAFDVILLDLHLPDGNALDLLHEVTARGDETAVIILTENADLNSAIQPLRLDAYDYLIKPCRIVELEQHLERIARQQRLRDENRALRLQILAQRDPSELVASGPPLSLVRNLVARAAPTNVSVLISGETGTGKEVAARLIHAQSLRRDEAFVPVNCAALPGELAESELFALYPWPGNVRVLRNVIERAKILCDQPDVQPEHLGLPVAEPKQPAALLAEGTIAQVEWLMI